MTQTLTPPALDDNAKYERILASDPACDGRFYFGVVTTGIYCRPSCRVRKPLRRNVRFFESPAQARAAGLRPCRRCHPDDAVRDDEVEREEVLTLLAELRADPALFPDVESLVVRSGYGSTRLFAMIRNVLGATPASVLHAARIEHAKQLLRTTPAAVFEVALASGYGSASVFHRRFRLATGVTPRAYRQRHNQPTGGRA